MLITSGLSSPSRPAPDSHSQRGPRALELGASSHGLGPGPVTEPQPAWHGQSQALPCSRRGGRCPACPLLAWPESCECVLPPGSRHGQLPAASSSSFPTLMAQHTLSSQLCEAIQKWDGYFLELSFLLPIQIKAIVASENNPLLTTRCRCFPGIMQSLEETG